MLTSSTSLKKEIKYHGELEGSSLEVVIVFIERIRILLNHSIKAADKLKERVVVTGKL